MRQKGKCFLLLSVFAFGGSIVFSGYCLGVYVNNQYCSSSAEYYTCSTAGSQSCERNPNEPWPGNGENTCFKCDSSSGMTIKICINKEGSRCTLAGGQGLNCEGVDREKALCMQLPPDSIGKCQNYVPDGTCDDKQNFMPCGD